MQKEITHHMRCEHFPLIPLINMNCDLLLCRHDQLFGLDINLCIAQALDLLLPDLDLLISEVCCF